MQKRRVLPKTRSPAFDPDETKEILGKGVFAVPWASFTLWLQEATPSSRICAAFLYESGLPKSKQMTIDIFDSSWLSLAPVT